MPINEVLEFNSTDGQWTVVGSMISERNFHAADAVPIEDILPYCQ